MTDPYKEIPDEQFFFSWVFIPFLKTIESFESYFEEDLHPKILNKAIELGYNRKKALQKVLDLQKRYTDQYHFAISFSTPQNNYCREAFHLILQEKISKEKLTIPSPLLLELTSYDTYLPENYTLEQPTDIDLPKKDKEKWLDFELKLPENIFENGDFVTIYSQKEVKYPAFSEELHEFDELSSAIIKNSKIEKFQDMLDDFDPGDIIRYPKTNTIEELKNLKNLPDKGMLFEHIIYKCDNNWKNHSDNKLVRISNEFIKENNLSWKNVLDMYHNDEHIIKFQFWVSPYNGDDDSRERIAKGVRLQIKNLFLENYLKEKNKSLIIIKEKIRRIVHPSIHHEKIEIKGKKQVKINKFYTPR